MISGSRGLGFFFRYSFLATCATLILVIGGCGSGEPFDYVKVHGTVRYDDGSLIPAGRLVVRFISQTKTGNPKIPAPQGNAEVNVKTGEFASVTSHKFGDGIVPGDHKVIIFPPQPDVVPEEYSKVETTPLMVSAQDSPFDIKIKKPTTK